LKIIQEFKGSGKEINNYQTWVVRDMIDVHAYKNANAKLQDAFLHQNAMAVIHVAINNNKL